MSKQMTKDWIEQEYHRWKKIPFCSPYRLDEQMEWVAKSFALHMLKLNSQFTRNQTIKQGYNKEESN